ncbi:MAG: radical SAM protein [Parasporobacterium sp.]|nr:radical SAM protein [Parasporobacterium sp.]
MNNKLMLYLHIPFCVRKCNYCDFVSFAGKDACFESYVQAICNEICAYGKFFGDREISSVYFGGGTPSILPAELLVRIMETIRNNFSLEKTKEKKENARVFLDRFRIKKADKQSKPLDLTEVSVECNPGTVDKQKLRAYKKAGVNRLSFGLQSADPEELKTIGRIHTFDDFTDALEFARETGFQNLNVDLMQAVPGQSIESWRKTLFLTALWKPEHISAYSLIVEEGTPFFEQQKKGLLNLPDEDTERRIYYYTKEFLEKSGYYRYEISNYAVPGYECRHNAGYWRRKEYLGLGLNASSMTDEVRRKNTADLKTYLSAFENPERALKIVSEACEQFAQKEPAAAIMNPVSEQDGSAGGSKAVQATGSKVIEEIHRLSRKEQMEEYMFLGLRMAEGIQKQDFFDTFGQDFDFTYGDVVYDLKTKELLEETDGRLFLTERGVDVSNQVFSEFLL